MKKSLPDVESVLSELKGVKARISSILEKYGEGAALDEEGGESALEDDFGAEEEEEESKEPRKGKVGIMIALMKKKKAK
jgi:hypothetical protein